MSTADTASFTNGTHCNLKHPILFHRSTYVNHKIIIPVAVQQQPTGLQRAE